MIYNVKPIRNPKPIMVEVPGSKSITNRALLIAALSQGKSTLKGVLFSDDSRHFLRALMDLGFPVEIDEDNKIVSITGYGGQIPKKTATINVGSAGTAARFLTAFLGLSEGEYTINSSDQMKKRPMKELLVALQKLGANISYLEEEYHFPFIIGSKGLKSNQIEIDVDKSSQFLSALLISSVLFKEDFVIDVTGHHGMAYVEMTLQMMEQFGVKVQKVDNHFEISKTSEYEARHYDIEPDLSAACYFYAMGAVLATRAKVKGVHFQCLQGDVNFLRVLSDMGCSLSEEKDGVVLEPSDGVLNGGKWDLSAFSDQALTLAAIAPFCQDRIIIEGISHIKYQECDRMKAIVDNLTAMGIECSCDDSSVTIIPGDIHEAHIETFEDHRVAMSFAIPGLVKEGIVIENPMCCRKTFENYFQVLEGLY